MFHPAFISPVKLLCVGIVVVLTLAGLLGRLVQLHVFKQEELRAMAERSRVSFSVVEARRGNIVDRRGNILAATRSTITLGFDPLRVREQDLPKVETLEDLIGEGSGRLREAMEGWRPVRSDGRPIQWVRFGEDVDEDLYDRILDLGIRGVYGNRRYQRHYPGGSLAAHVLGFVNREGVPAFGIEREMNFYLSGQRGWRETERDGRRRELTAFRDREVAPTDGMQVELSLDLMAQAIVEREVEHLANTFTPEAISIIVSLPGTGEILALANFPTIDLNRFWSYPMEYHRNRAITDVFEPGSTFKIVPAAAALDEKRVRPDSVFDCDVAAVRYNGRRVSLPKDHRPMGKLSVEEIIVRSSNRGAAFLGMLLGSEGLYEWVRQFGFGERTGVLMTGEVRGTVHPVGRWDGLTISRMPMGHAINATALQVHQATSVIASGGVLMEPQVVRRVLDASGNTLVEVGPSVKRRVVDRETADLMAGFLAGVVGGEGGTARNARIEGYAAAGKTGTTQMLVDGRYSNRHHVASFSGFFPADDPRLVITVVVTDPRREGGTGYGGVVAAPAFQRIGEELAAYLGIRPTGEAVPGMMAGLLP